jgi:hypothetical protein
LLREKLKNTLRIIEWFLSDYSPAMLTKEFDEVLDSCEPAPSRLVGYPSLLVDAMGGERATLEMEIDCLPDWQEVGGNAVWPLDWNVWQGPMLSRAKPYEAIEKFLRWCYT